MSKTPWPAGLSPVMKEGHAHHECDGTVDRQSPYAPRLMKSERTGSSPASSMGRRIFQSTPSQPIISTRLATTRLIRRLPGGTPRGDVLAAPAEDAACPPGCAATIPSAL